MAGAIGINHVALEVGDLEQAVQFTKAPEVLKGMGAGQLEKSEAALRQLRRRGSARGSEDRP